MEKDSIQAKLELLEKNHRDLESKLLDQQRQITFLRAKLGQSSPASSEAMAETPPPIHFDTSKTTAKLEPAQKKTATPEPSGDSKVKITPPPLPASVHSKETAPEKVSQVPHKESEPVLAKSNAIDFETNHTEAQVEKPQKKRSVEMQVGRVWLVRLGIISILTGLVFLSNYAYRNWIMDLGALPRITCLFLVSSFMVALGSFFERKKDSLKSYGRVIAGGGMAMLYYTAFAAHNIERLKVIESPLLGGILLLFSALLCLCYSLWRKSEITAATSIALAFYATSINPIGSFSLISSILLTATGIYLLGKMKSLSIGFTTLLASYLSFTYWQFFVHHAEATPHSHLFLVAYWILGTTAVMIHKNAFKQLSIHLFAALNNGLFFLLFCIDYSTGRLLDPLWPFAAIYGGTLVGISLAMKTLKSHGSSLRGAYLAQGLALITLAVTLWLDGPHIAIALAIQCALLLFIGLRKWDILLLTASALSLFLNFIFYLDNLPEVSALQHSILTVIYLGIALIGALNGRKLPKEFQLAIQGIPSLLATFAFALFVSNITVEATTKILILLGTATLSNLLLFLPKKRNLLPVLPYLTHLYTVIALLSVFELPELEASFSATVTAILAIMTAIHTALRLRHKSTSLHAIYIPITTVTLAVTLFLTESESLYLLALSILPMLYHALSDGIRVQSFKTVGLISYPVSWLSMLAFLVLRDDVPDFTFFLTAVVPITHYALMRIKTLSSVPFTSGYLLTGATLLLHLWLASVTDHWPLITASIGLGFLSLEERKQLGSLTTLGLLSMGVAILASHTSDQPFLLRYLVSFTPLVGYFVYSLKKTIPRHKEITSLLAIAASLALWLTTSIHTSDLIGNGGLSICWALVGFLPLSLGLMIKDKTFRSMGFLILGFCVLHVYGVDVWKLNTLLRIFSFITLGVVLIIAGYLYCKKIDGDKEEEN